MITNPWQAKDFLGEEAHAFYETYAHEPIGKLMLKFGTSAQKKLWIQQIDSRQRALHKIPEWLENNNVVLPPKENLQQASSSLTAAYKAQIIPHKTSIDLTGGSGIDSWQLRLHGQKHIYVEPNYSLCTLANHNFEALGFSDVEIVKKTAQDFLSNYTSHADLVYLDPSRRLGGGKKLVLLEDYEPNLLQILPDIFKITDQVLVKVSPLADLTYLQKNLQPWLIHIYIVAVKNDCKEILLHLQPKPKRFTGITATNLGTVETELSMAEIDENEPVTYAKNMFTYLYEPNAAVFKTGAFNTLSHVFRLEKLDKNTHLYTSDSLEVNFPGKIYTVVEVAKPYRLHGSYPSFSIAARNFVDTPEHIRKKLKIKDGEDYRLMATQISGSKIFIVCKAV